MPTGKPRPGAKERDTRHEGSEQYGQGGQLLAATAVKAASWPRRTVGTSLPPGNRSSSPARTQTYLPPAISGTATPSPWSAT